MELYGPILNLVFDFREIFFDVSLILFMVSCVFSSPSWYDVRKTLPNVSQNSISRKAKIQNICSGGGYRWVDHPRFRKDENGKRENHDFSEYMIFVRAGRAKISSAARFAKTRDPQKTPKYGVYIRLGGLL